MKRRVVLWLMIAMMLLAAMPAACAAKSGRVEDIKVERTESGITVTIPAGYADQGFYKLFWMNGQTGEVQNAVFEVDTPSYLIEAEEGTEYSVALFYAKKKGGLPASWKGDGPKVPKGPSVWKVLWIDAETIEFRGITNQMSEANHRTSEEAAVDFEALIEDYTGGLVDIQITRMSVDEPFTSMTYYTNIGYAPTAEDINIDHYAKFSYDSVFVFGRVDEIFMRYGGIAFQPEEARDYPGYSFIPLVGDDCILQGAEEVIKYVCVHEFIHQLGYLYKQYSLVIPDPDEMVKYGYDPESNDLDPQFFRDALTMKVIADDGKYIGVPAEAWQYKPTHRPVKWDLSYMQDQYGEARALVQEEPASTAEPENPEIYGIIEEYGYDNTVMGVKGVFDEDWIIYAPDSFPFDIPEQTEVPDDIPDFLKEERTFIPMFAQSSTEPDEVCLSLHPSAAKYMKENGEEPYWQALKDLYERQASLDGLDDFACDIIERNIGGRTVTCLKMEYTAATVKVYTVRAGWLNGDYMSMITASSFMSDDTDSILGYFSFPAD